MQKEEQLKSKRKLKSLVTSLLPDFSGFQRVFKT